MSVYDFFKNLIKHRRIFAFLIAAAIVLCTAGIRFANSDTAEIVIKYLGEDAKRGLTENGQQINPYEINSAIVVKNAAEQLGLDKKGANIDSICRSITITPIVPTSEQEKYASWIESFSDYDNSEENKDSTVYYSVKFTSKHGPDYTKRMLSAVINEYRLFYVEKYTYENNVTQLSGEAAMQYDYYETVCLLKDKINSNIDYLNNIAKSGDYLSPQTGYSLADLAQEYKTLSERTLSVAERLILENGISKNPWHLRNALADKAVNAQTESSLNAEKAQTNKHLMSIYSSKNQQYLWEDNGETRESNQVRENADDHYGYTPEKSTYDALVLDCVKFRTESENLLIDKQIYEKNIGSFPDGFDNTALKNETENLLNTACSEFNELFQITRKTVSDYNSYKSSGSISCISGVVVSSTVNSVFYYAVSLILALMFGIIFCTAAELIKESRRTKQRQAGENV